MKHMKQRSEEEIAAYVTRMNARVMEIDVFRGIAVFLMVFDHLMFDLFGTMPAVMSDFPGSSGFWHKLSSLALDYWTWPVREDVRYVVLFVFLATTGICCTFSRNNLRRSLELWGVSLALTLVTALAGLLMGDMDITITYGVLHCIATALLLIALLERVCKSKWVYLGIGIVLVAIGIPLEVHATSVLYSSGPLVLVILKQIAGIVNVGGDSFQFPLYGGLVFIGYFLGKLLYQKKTSLFGWRYRNNLLTAVGRHSLLVYIGHQVVFFMLLTLLLLLCGFHLSI